MPDKPDKAFQILDKKCEEIGWGRWKIELVIHQGRCVGFTQLDSPAVEYREIREKNGAKSEEV